LRLKNDVDESCDVVVAVAVVAVAVVAAVAAVVLFRCPFLARA
jgi:hypothetical protein